MVNDPTFRLIAMSNPNMNPIMEEVFKNPEALNAFLDWLSNPENLDAMTLLITSLFDAETVDGILLTLQGLQKVAVQMTSLVESNPEIGRMLMDFVSLHSKIQSTLVNRRIVATAVNNQVDLELEETYKKQLAFLRSMGFTNRAENIAALKLSGGDVQVAARLISLPRP